MSTVTSKNKQTWSPSKTYTFKLVGQGAKHQGKYHLPTTSIIYDPETNGRREVRVSPTEKSPFVDEQSANALGYTQLLTFHKGKMTVSGRDEFLLNYLMALDHNVDKSGVHAKPLYQYKLQDPELSEKEKATAKKLRLKVQLRLAEATKEELADFLESEYGYQPQTDTEEELFNRAMAYAEQNPEHVLKSFNTEETKMKASIARAFKAQKLKQVNGVVTWKETGLEIGVFKPTADKKLIQLMVEWVDKGSKEANDFVKKLSTI